MEIQKDQCPDVEVERTQMIFMAVKKQYDFYDGYMSL